MATKAASYAWIDYEISAVADGVRIQLLEDGRPTLMVMAGTTADALLVVREGLRRGRKLRIVDRAPKTFLRGRFLCEVMDAA